MEHMTLEQTYCRGPVAKLFNAQHDYIWLPNRNTGDGTYISGTPDGYAVRLRPAMNRGEHAALLVLANAAGECTRLLQKMPDAAVDVLIAIECKADMGSLYLGNPGDENATDGWHFHQRQWWREIAVASQLPYFIAAWVYSERKPSRVYQKNARLFLVPPEAWLATEAKLNGRKTLSLNADLEHERAYKDITAESEFASFALVFDQGQWQIPANHPFWQTTLSTRRES